MKCVIGAFIMVAVLRVEVGSIITTNLDLSNSYLPVAMQLLASLIDQLQYDHDDNPPIARPAATPAKPATPKPATLSNLPHRPGNFAPLKPPNPADIKLQFKPEDIPPVRLLPPHGLAEEYYSVIRPEPPAQKIHLLPGVEDSAVPIPVEQPVQLGLLPLQYESRTSDGDTNTWKLTDSELSDEALQYLSPTIKELLKLGQDESDERLIIADDVKEVATGPAVRPVSRTEKGSSEIRMSLLYDQLSRDAKKQKLNAYQGYSGTILEDLADSWSGGAASQLSIILQRMIDRGDCTHEFANNRARDMVRDLKNSSSTMARELRYLIPLYFDMDE